MALYAKPWHYFSKPWHYMLNHDIVC